MSVLIITTPRTGSTVLTKALAYSLKYRPVFEPLNPIWAEGSERGILPPETNYSDIDFDSIDHNSKYVVKCMTYQLPDDTNTLDYFIEFSKKFKHVIILDRKNIEEQSKSYAIAAERTKTEGRNHFGSPYSSDYPIDKEAINNRLQSLINEKPKLELLELELGVNRVWYEDLYSDVRRKRKKLIIEALNGLEFDTTLYLKYTDPQMKYKKDSTKRSLI